MNKSIKYFFLIGIVLGIHCFGLAQYSVNAAGGDVFGAGGSASYSVGQIVYTTIGANGTTVAQGVQQAAQMQIIPTMSEWGFIILLLLFIIVGVQSLKVKEDRKLISSPIFIAGKRAGLTNKILKKR
ncbi:MAG TPA: hypothetical protein PLZ32_04740 [Saprospiraceae bacterium]|nr:hypothetical protein [Saprospiraceae bacterium]